MQNSIMPSRSSLIIAIGEVIEAHPPSRSRLKRHSCSESLDFNSGGDDESDSSVSQHSDERSSKMTKRGRVIKKQPSPSPVIKKEPLDVTSSPSLICSPIKTEDVKPPPVDDISPKSKKRRTELAKLLEAGSSSFHCSSAKEQLQQQEHKQQPKYEFEDPPSPHEGTPPPTSKSPKKIEAPQEPSSNLIIPPTTFEDLENRLEPELNAVDSLFFSFEKSPSLEGWFETYNRQDQGEEDLYYPNTECFPLPYQMPISTFYYGTKPETSKKVRKPKPKLPPLQRPRREEVKPPKIIKQLGPKVSQSLWKESRKSPRGHASTKSLLSGGEGDSKISPDETSNESVPVEEIEEEEEEEESERSSTPPPASTGISNDNLVAELDEFFRSEDPILSTTEDSPKKKKKDECMDNIVSGQVDSLLLDCLEDELPSVCFQDTSNLEMESIFKDYSSLDLSKLIKKVPGRKSMKPNPFIRDPSADGSTGSSSCFEDEDGSIRISKGVMKKRGPKKKSSLISPKSLNKLNATSGFKKKLNNGHFTPPSDCPTKKSKLVQKKKIPQSKILVSSRANRRSSQMLEPEPAEPSVSSTPSERFRAARPSKSYKEIDSESEDSEYFRLQKNKLITKRLVPFSRKKRILLKRKKKKKAS